MFTNQIEFQVISNICYFTKGYNDKFSVSTRFFVNMKLYGKCHYSAIVTVHNCLIATACITFMYQTMKISISQMNLRRNVYRQHTNSESLFTVQVNMLLAHTIPQFLVN